MRAARESTSRRASSPTCASARATSPGSCATDRGVTFGLRRSIWLAGGGKGPSLIRKRTTPALGTPSRILVSKSSCRKESSCAHAAERAWTIKVPRTRRTGRALRATRGGTTRAHQAKARSAARSAGSREG